MMDRQNCCCFAFESISFFEADDFASYHIPVLDSSPGVVFFGGLCRSGTEHVFGGRAWISDTLVDTTCFQTVLIWKLFLKNHP